MLRVKFAKSLTFCVQVHLRWWSCFWSSQCSSCPWRCRQCQKASFQISCWGLCTKRRQYSILFITQFSCAGFCMISDFLPATLGVKAFVILWDVVVVLIVLISSESFFHCSIIASDSFLPDLIKYSLLLHRRKWIQLKEGLAAGSYLALAVHECCIEKFGEEKVRESIALI